MASPQKGTFSSLSFFQASAGGNVSSSSVSQGHENPEFFTFWLKKAHCSFRPEKFKLTFTEDIRGLKGADNLVVALGNARYRVHSKLQNLPKLAQQFFAKERSEDQRNAISIAIQNHILPRLALLFFQGGNLRLGQDNLKQWKGSKSKLSKKQEHSTDVLKSAKRLIDLGVQKERGLEPEAAAEDFLKAAALVSKYPGLAAEYLSRASKQLSDRSYVPGTPLPLVRQYNQRALELALEAVVLDPTCPYGYAAACVSRGRLAVATSNSRTKVSLAKQAQDDVHTALRLDPTFDMAHHLLGRWNAEMASLNAVVRGLVAIVFGTQLMPGSYQEARRCFETAVALAPQRMVHRVELGRTLWRLGDRREAVVELRGAMQLEIEDINAQLLLEEAQDLVDQYRRSHGKEYELMSAELSLGGGKRASSSAEKATVITATATDVLGSQAAAKNAGSGAKGVESSGLSAGHGLAAAAAADAYCTSFPQTPLVPSRPGGRASGDSGKRGGGGSDVKMSEREATLSAPALCEKQDVHDNKGIAPSPGGDIVSKVPFLGGLFHAIAGRRRESTSTREDPVTSLVSSTSATASSGSSSVKCSAKEPPKATVEKHVNSPFNSSASSAIMRQGEMMDAEDSSGSAPVMPLDYSAALNMLRVSLFAAQQTVAAAAAAAKSGGRASPQSSAATILTTNAKLQNNAPTPAGALTQASTTVADKVDSGSAPESMPKAVSSSAISPDVAKQPAPPPSSRHSPGLALVSSTGSLTLAAGKTMFFGEGRERQGAARRSATGFTSSASLPSLSLSLEPRGSPQLQSSHPSPYDDRVRHLTYDCNEDEYEARCQEESPFFLQQYRQLYRHFPSSPVGAAAGFMRRIASLPIVPFTSLPPPVPLLGLPSRRSEPITAEPGVLENMGTVSLASPSLVTSTLPSFSFTETPVFLPLSPPSAGLPSSRDAGPTVAGSGTTSKAAAGKLGYVETLPTRISRAAPSASSSLYRSFCPPSLRYPRSIPGRKTMTGNMGSGVGGPDASYAPSSTPTAAPFSPPSHHPALAVLASSSAASPPLSSLLHTPHSFTSAARKLCLMKRVVSADNVITNRCSGENAAAVTAAASATAVALQLRPGPLERSREQQHLPRVQSPDHDQDGDVPIRYGQQQQQQHPCVGEDRRLHRTSKDPLSLSLVRRLGFEESNAAGALHRYNRSPAVDQEGGVAPDAVASKSLDGRPLLSSSMPSLASAGSGAPPIGERAMRILVSNPRGAAGDGDGRAVAVSSSSPDRAAFPSTAATTDSVSTPVQTTTSAVGASAFPGLLPSSLPRDTTMTTWSSLPTGVEAQKWREALRRGWIQDPDQEGSGGASVAEEAHDLDYGGAEGLFSIGECRISPSVKTYHVRNVLAPSPQATGSLSVVEGQSSSACSFWSPSPSLVLPPSSDAGAPLATMGGAARGTNRRSGKNSVKSGLSTAFATAPEALTEKGGEPLGPSYGTAPSDAAVARDGGGAAKGLTLEGGKEEMVLTCGGGGGDKGGSTGVDDVRSSVSDSAGKDDKRAFGCGCASGRIQPSASFVFFPAADRQQYNEQQSNRAEGLGGLLSGSAPPSYYSSASSSLNSASPATAAAALGFIVATVGHKGGGDADDTGGTGVFAEAGLAESQLQPVLCNRSASSFQLPPPAPSSSLPLSVPTLRNPAAFIGNEVEGDQSRGGGMPRLAPLSSASPPVPPLAHNVALFAPSSIPAHLLSLATELTAINDVAALPAEATSGGPPELEHGGERSVNPFIPGAAARNAVPRMDRGAPLPCVIPKKGGILAALARRVTSGRRGGQRKRAAAVSLSSSSMALSPPEALGDRPPAVTAAGGYSGGGGRKSGAKAGKSAVSSVVAVVAAASAVAAMAGPMALAAVITTAGG